MKIKLKANSSVEIVNRNGTTLVKVNEDGGVEVQPSVLVNLTHSFDELGQSLKEIIDHAIDDGNAPCTEAEWAVIKKLLDNSLYLNFDTVSMIKTYSNGIDNYMFGGVTADSDVGISFRIFYQRGLIYCFPREL